MSRRTRGATRGVAAVTAGLVVASVALAAPATAAPVEKRLFGPDRFGTSVDIAEDGFFPNNPRNIIIASGEAFPDALAGAALAGFAANGKSSGSRSNVPILLTEADDLPSDIATYLEGLAENDNRTFWILGGEAAVSDDVKMAIETANPGSEKFERIKGANRYVTAAEIAKVIGDPRGLTVADVAYDNVVFLATGGKFVDALAAGPQAYGKPTKSFEPNEVHPVLLTPPTGPLNISTAAYISNLEGKTLVLVMGGGAAVPDTVDAELAALGDVTPFRVEGTNRYDTAKVLATTLVSLEEADPANVGLASGEKFPDALSAAPYLGFAEAPLVLSQSDALPTATEEFLESVADTPVETLHVFGGTGAVSNDVVNEAITAATGTP